MMSAWFCLLHWFYWWSLWLVLWSYGLSEDIVVYFEDFCFDEFFVFLDIFFLFSVCLSFRKRGKWLLGAPMYQFLTSITFLQCILDTRKWSNWNFSFVTGWVYIRSAIVSNMVHISIHQDVWEAWRCSWRWRGRFLKVWQGLLHRATQKFSDWTIENLRRQNKLRAHFSHRKNASSYRKLYPRIQESVGQQEFLQGNHFRKSRN